MAPETPPAREGAAQPPGWADFMTTAGFAYFVHAVARDMSGRGFVAGINTDAGVMHIDGRPAVFGLTTLAQVCHGAPLDEWDGIIREHFDDLPVDDPHFGAQPGFGDIREHLRTRLLPAGIAGHDASVMRPVADGIVEVLVIDEPHRVRSVARDIARAWGLTEIELLDAGRTLVHECESVDVDVEMIDASTTVTLLHGATHFVATHALWPLDHCPHHAPSGVILAVPNRHVVFIHEVRDISVVGAINALGRSIPAMFRAGPGSISPLVYWWFEGTFTTIPMRVGDDRVLSVSPPSALTHLLNRLPERADDA